MSLFGRSQKKKTDAVPAVPAAVSQTTPVSRAGTLRSPRITEKATFLQSRGAYVFDVDSSATKTQIAEDVSRLYGVKPRAVKVVRIPSKAVRSMKTGKSGVKSGGKKAYVFLKKGDTITIA